MLSITLVSGGLYPVGLSALSSEVRADIRGGSLPLMALLYGIGRDWLGATVAPMSRTSGFDARSFMTFDPIETVYYEPGTEGSYVSNTTDIERYIATFRKLMRIEMPASHRMLYILAIILDFIAFVAQTMRAVIENRVATHRHLKGIRLLTHCMHSR